MSKPSKTCLSDFISKLLNLSYPSALGLHEEEGKSFSDVVKEDIQMVDVTVWNCLELLNTLCNNNNNDDALRATPGGYPRVPKDTLTCRLEKPVIGRCPTPPPDSYFWHYVENM